MSIASNIKGWVPTGVGSAVSGLRQEVAIALRHRRGVRAAQIRRSKVAQAQRWWREQHQAGMGECRSG